MSHNSKRIQIMSHLVAGYPDRNGFLSALQGLKDGGSDILELQIPFSDPTADGPIITTANEEALRAGFQIKDIFQYIENAHAVGFDRIVVMTYANIPFKYGIKRYVTDMKNAGVEAILAPDLPIEDEEGFYQAAFDAKIAPMPVVVVNMSEERLALLRSKPFAKIYAAIRTGITGQETQIDHSVESFLSRFRPGYEIFAGFGIRSARQIQALTSFADVAVVGSYFTQIVADAYAGNQDIYAAVYHACGQLLPNV